MDFFVSLKLYEETMNVVINITTAPATLPAGMIAGLLALSITDPAGQPVLDSMGQPISSQQVAGTTATFANVGPGNYLASAARLDTNGSVMGAQVSQAFTVPAPVEAPASATPESTGQASASFDAPQAITVTLS